MDGPVSFVMFCWWWLFFSFGVSGNGLPVHSSPCIYLNFVLCFHQVVRVEFLVLCGWRAVGSRPEGLGLMAFSMLPGKKHPGNVGFFLCHS